MVFESSLAQTAAQLGDSLSVRSAQTEKMVEEQAAESKTPEQSGDMITISDEARALIAVEQSENDGEQSSLGMKADDKARSGGTPMSSLDSYGEAESTEEGPKSPLEQLIEQLKQQIAEVEEEIKTLEESDLPEKSKIQQVQAKEAHLMELRDQLLKAEQAMLKGEGMADGGGTRANGFGNSVESF